LPKKIVERSGMFFGRVKAGPSTHHVYHAIPHKKLQIYHRKNTALPRHPAKTLEKPPKLFLEIHFKKN
jgi:hypothetical protein